MDHLKNSFWFRAMVFLLLLEGISVIAFSSSIKKNLETGSLTPEYIMLTTDRDMYVAGENVLFNLNILSKENTGNNYSNICYVVLRNQYNSFVKIQIKADNNCAYGSFYLPDTLKTGYYEIVAFTNYMRNFGEQIYFRKNLIIANRFDEWLNNLFQNNNSTNALSDTTNFSFNESENSPFSLRLEKDSFKVREKVTLGIETDDETRNQVNGKVAISVRQINPYTRYIINKENNADSPQLLNSISKTHYYPIERNGMFYSGAIMQRDTTPVRNECLFLSTPDSIANLQYAFSDEKGVFQFFLSDYYYGKQIILNTKLNRNGEYLIIPDDKFQLKQPFNPLYLGFPRELRKYIVESQKLVSIQKMYALKSIKTEPSGNYNYAIPKVYTEPATTTFTSDFVALKNFREISDNILSGIKIREIDGTYFPFVVNYSINQYFQNPSAVFLDGVPIYNLNAIMNYGSQDITKIEICHSSRIKGDLQFSGIVSITTKRKNNSYSFLPGSMTATVEKLTDPSFFVAPRYGNATIKDPNPDLRQLLYWNPQLDINSQENSAELFASDWPGEYIIEIKGITKKGVVFSKYSKFKVYR